MCKQDCVYLGAGVKRWGRGEMSCNYSSAMMLTDREYKTRTGTLTHQVEKRHPDWPAAKKAKWVQKRLRGENCPFFEPRKPGSKRAKTIRAVTPQKPAEEKKKSTRKGKMDQDLVWKLYRQGMNDREIAATLGNVTDGAVYSWREKNELPANGKPGGEHKKMDRAEFRRLYDQGLNDTEIAGKIGCSEVTVQKWRYENGLLKNGRKLPGRRKDARAERYLEEKHAQEGEET